MSEEVSSWLSPLMLMIATGYPPSQSRINLVGGGSPSRQIGALGGQGGLEAPTEGECASNDQAAHDGDNQRVFGCRSAAVVGLDRTKKLHHDNLSLFLGACRICIC